MDLEARYLRQLQEQYGRSETIGFYGECNLPYDVEKLKKLGRRQKSIEKYLKSQAIKFNETRRTSLVEVGEPLD